ncbi:hypothetical protein N431DRAFT_560893 [Stipitochalara longipes BDJ]|nr:hypothetical protein N431DRAFT_560893 [Stipitochalara longipes BDJ]
MASEENMPSKPFQFLDLAPELRHKIYILIVTSPHPPIDLSSTYISPHTHFPHALLLTCTQIYHELRPLYFTKNAFSITILRRNDSWSHILTPTFLDNRRQIRSLRILITRWGTRNFFCRSLIPALEDCILNGRLRELEVMVRDGGDVGALNESRWEHENWVQLKSVLRDPYLERATLKAGRFTIKKNDIEGQGWELDKWTDLSFLLESARVETSIKVI